MAARLGFGLLGLLAGLSFFAKMQSMPLTLVVAAVSFGYFLATTSLNRCIPPAGLFVAGAVLPLESIAASSLPTGVWGDFWTSYIEGNQAYVGQAGGIGQPSAPFILFLVQADEPRLFFFTFLALLVAPLFQKSRLLRGQKR
jgi:hypothetical protein